MTIYEFMCGVMRKPANYKKSGAYDAWARWVSRKTRVFAPWPAASVIEDGDNYENCMRARDAIRGEVLAA
ncbi:hypothetical protein [Hyphomicrobium sp. DY-1]|uniref:hypothetical protein n=1 Tax=Hyphomicrobium sp. DY-1 TaxID=3075650 RepID=UPI0039C13688